MSIIQELQRKRGTKVLITLKSGVQVKAAVINRFDDDVVYMSSGSMLGVNDVAAIEPAPDDDAKGAA